MESVTHFQSSFNLNHLSWDILYTFFSSPFFLGFEYLCIHCRWDRNAFKTHHRRIQHRRRRFLREDIRWGMAPQNQASESTNKWQSCTARVTTMYKRLWICKSLRFFLTWTTIKRSIKNSCWCSPGWTPPLHTTQCGETNAGVQPWLHSYTMSVEGLGAFLTNVDFLGHQQVSIYEWAISTSHCFLIPNPYHNLSFVHSSWKTYQTRWSIKWPTASRLCTLRLFSSTLSSLTQATGRSISPWG